MRNEGDSHGIELFTAGDETLLPPGAVLIVAACRRRTAEGRMRVTSNDRRHRFLCGCRPVVLNPSGSQTFNGIPSIAHGACISNDEIRHIACRSPRWDDFGRRIEHAADNF